MSDAKKKGTPGLIKRGDKVWLIKYDIAKDPVTGRRRTRYETFHGTQKDAEKRRRELLTSSDKGMYIDNSKMTLSEWAARWLKSIAADVTPRTLEGYELLLNTHVLPTLGAVPVQKVSASQIAELYANLARSGHKRSTAEQPLGLSPTTRRHVHRVLSQCLDSAAMLDVIVFNPVTKVVTRRNKAGTSAKVNGASKAIGQENLTVLLAGIRQHWLFPIIALTAGTGLRRQEVMALRWSDIDFERKTLSVNRVIEETRTHGSRIVDRAKSDGSVRTIRLDDGLLGLLRSVRTKLQETAFRLGRPQLPADALVFPSLVQKRKGRQPRNAPPGAIVDFTAHHRLGSVTKTFSGLCKQLGFPGFTFHRLRHTHATLLLNLRLPIVAVQKRLGHSKASTTTDIYAHVLEETEQDTADAAGSLLKATLGGVG